jgi:hypothetical protein
LFSTAFTSGQIHPSFGKELDNTKPKETKTKSKSVSKTKCEDTSKDESKAKDDAGTNDDNSKPEADIIL